MGESDSMYSSFEESSIMSIPELMEDSFTTEDKDEFPSSMSLSDVSDPVSPLQKTLSTWQAFENWVRKKHDFIVKPEVISRRQQMSNEKSDSVLIPEEILLDELDHNDDDIVTNLNELQQHSIADSSANVSLDSSEDSLGEERIEVMDHLHACFQLPCLHSFFYYIAWCLLISNIILALVFTFVKASSFSLTKCSFWLKHVFIEILCSFFIITPFLIILFSFVSSLKIYTESLSNSTVFYSQNVKETSNKNETEVIEPSYNRIEYLKRYLRPPREQILEEFRKSAVKEKNIFYIQSNVWQYILMLVLLLILSFPEDTRNRYLQRTSIFNTFFRSKDMSAWQKPLNSTLQLCNWLEDDFIEGLYGDDQCWDQYSECGITSSTGCILIGKTVMRVFKMPMCHQYATSNCYSSPRDPTDVVTDEDYLYEFQPLKGYNGLYFQEDQVIVLGDDKYEAQEKIYNVVPYLLNFTSGAVSMELILFNPSLSSFVSLLFLFEITDSGILLGREVLYAKVPETSSLLYHAYFSLHLLFILIILVKCKNQCWHVLKYGKQFWKVGWNYFFVLFNMFSIVYLIVYLIYTVYLKRVVSKLEDIHFTSHLSVTDLAHFETASRELLTVLFSLHLIGALRVLNFSPRLKKLIKKLTNSMKIVLTSFLVLLCFISFCNFLLKYFVGMDTNLSHPFVIFLKGVNFIFKDFNKPEVKNANHSLSTLFSIVVMFIIVALYVFFVAFIRSILINAKCTAPRTREKISFKDTRNAVKKRILDSLQPKVPQIVEKSDHMPPIEFLLLELEQLADKLLVKAENLFGEKDICEEIMLDSKLCSSSVEGYLRSQCQLLDKGDLELPVSESKFTCGDLQHWNPQFGLDSSEEIQIEVSERLNATMPRQTKPRGKIFLPSSLNASLASQRKFKHQAANLNLSASLQSHKIRKTYPLCQVDVGSSSESTSDSDDNAHGVSVRKTKSRGKGKHDDLNLTVLDDSPSSQ